MIKTQQQAERVQRARYKAGRRGVAKAVRRWARRTGNGAFVSSLPRNTEPPEIEDDAG
jgi:hypothetical protein